MQQQFDFLLVEPDKAANSKYMFMLDTWFPPFFIYILNCLNLDDKLTATNP